MVLHIETRLELRFSTAWNVWSCQCRIISSILFYLSCFVFLLACSDVMSYHEWLSLSLYIFDIIWLIWVRDMTSDYATVLCWLRCVVVCCRECIYAYLQYSICYYLCIWCMSWKHVFIYITFNAYQYAAFHQHPLFCRLWSYEKNLSCLGCKGGYTTLCSRVYYILLWESLLNSQYNEK